MIGSFISGGRSWRIPEIASRMSCVPTCEILLEQEQRDDLRVTVSGRAVDLVHAGDALDCVLDRLQDLALDSFRRRARIRNARHHDRLLNVGEFVGLQAPERESPNTTSATIVTTVIIGRLIAKSEMIICQIPPPVTVAGAAGADEIFTAVPGVIPCAAPRSSVSPADRPDRISIVSELLSVIPTCT